jgi:hypothetical protein
MNLGRNPSLGEALPNWFGLGGAFKKCHSNPAHIFQFQTPLIIRCLARLLVPLKTNALQTAMNVLAG